jgi:drug/metabolite transporter (DMT)-like permease
MRMNHAARGPLSPLILVCLLATWLVWGSTYLAIKFALPAFPPFFQMGSRFLVAGALLFSWVWLRGQQLPGAREWRNAVLIGALMLCGGMGCVAYAEQSVASGLVVVFIAICPALIAVANLPFGNRPARMEVLGIAVGLAGVALLVSGAGFRASPMGLTAVATATVCWSLGSVLSLHRFPLARGPAGFASEMLCGGVLLMLLSMVLGERFHWPAPPLAILAWAYLVVFGSLVAFTAYMTLLAHTRAALATSYTFVNPLIALLLGIGFAGEQVTRREWLAAGIVVLGVILLIVGRPADGTRGSASTTITARASRQARPTAKDP